MTVQVRESLASTSLSGSPTLSTCFAVPPGAADS